MNYYKIQSQFSKVLHDLELIKNCPDKLEKELIKFLPIAHEANLALLEISHELEVAKDESFEFKVKHDNLCEVVALAETAIQEYKKKLEAEIKYE